MPAAERQLKDDMTLSPDGRKTLALLEGYRPKVYRDAAGLPTVGVGHLLTRQELTTGKIEINGIDVKYTLHGLSQQHIYDLLAQDVGRFENSVNACVHVPLTQNQFDALICLAFNIGVCAFRNSTLVRLLNEGQYSEVPAQFMRWTRSAGKELAGLVRRRKIEAELWKKTTC